MKTMTLDELEKLPPLSEEEIREIKAFKNTVFDDCPIQTESDLKEFKPWYEIEQQTVLNNV